MTCRSTVKWCSRKILKRHFPLQLFVIQEPPQRKSLPHRSWCPICVQGRARDRPHRRVDRSEYPLPELHFDYVFYGTRDESETQAIQIMRDTKTGMMLAHHVPKKGMSNVHGAREIIKDVEKLGYDKILLRWQESERKKLFWRIRQLGTQKQAAWQKGRFRLLESSSG